MEEREREGAGEDRGERGEDGREGEGENCNSLLDVYIF